MSAVWQTQKQNKSSKQKKESPDPTTSTTTMSELVSPTPQCSRCHRAGHLARDCEVVSFLKPVAAPAAARVLTCFRCKLPGHFARDCRLPASKLKKSEDTCSSVGSTAASTTALANEDAPLNCFRCGKAGHVRSNCTFNLALCLLCGEQDHETSRCTNMLCFECHEKGHKSSACPQRAERLAREHQQYEDLVALERQQQRRLGQKKSTGEWWAAQPLPAAAAKRSSSPNTPEARPAPEIRSCELFPPLGAKTPAKRPGGAKKHADLDKMD